MILCIIYFQAVKRYIVYNLKIGNYHLKYNNMLNLIKEISKLIFGGTVFIILGLFGICYTLIKHLWKFDHFFTAGPYKPLKELLYLPISGSISTLSRFSCRNHR